MTRSLVLTIAVAVLTGCRTGTALVSLQALDPGDACPDGGTTLATGVDADKDGVLSAEEIDQTVVICNGSAGTDGSDGSDGSDGADGNDGTAGEDGAAVVFRTSTLPLGDADCPGGGTLIEFGLDDGTGGETAGDGVLGDGEVQSSQAICDGAPAIVPDSSDEPGGAAGTGVIDLSGGDGSSGAGGSAGDVEIYTAQDNTANVKLFTTGAVDASFTLPTVTADLGTTPLEITADTTIPGFIDATEVSGLSDGDPFYDAFDGRLFLFDGGGAHDEITGLRVAAGATLTLDPPSDTVSFGIDTLIVDGTLTTGFSEGQRAMLDLSGQLLHVSPTGVIDTSDDAAGTSNEQQLNFEVVVMEGTLDASASEDGASGSQIDAYGDYGMYATGQLLTYGADSTSGDGGQGGDAFVGTQTEGSVFSSARIDAHGGAGGDGDGGDGGRVEVWCNNSCEVRSSGAIEAYGGASVDGHAGTGGHAEIYGYGGALMSTGDVDLHGGTTSGGGDGGEGGDLDIYVGHSSRRPGAIHVSGTFDLSGGDGDAGGEGGRFSAYHDDDLSGAFAPIALYGFSSAMLDGGDGAGEGDAGSGGDFSLYRDDYESTEPSVPVGIVNYVPVSARSGSAEEQGSEPGSVSLYCDDWDEGEPCYVLSSASYDVSCGDGPWSDPCGSLYLDAASWVRHTGDVTMDGGDAVDDDASRGGDISVYATTTLEWSGSVSANGGNTADGGSSAGYGGDVYLTAGHVTWEGDLRMAGGDGGEAGHGGYAWIQSYYGGTDLTIGVADVAAGTGDDPEHGQVWVDGLDVTAALTTP